MPEAPLLPPLDIEILRDIVKDHPPGSSALCSLWVVKLMIADNDQVTIESDYWDDKRDLLFRLLAMSLSRLSKRSLIQLRLIDTDEVVAAGSDIWNSIVEEMNQGRRPHFENAIYYRFYPTELGIMVANDKQYPSFL